MTFPSPIAIATERINPLTRPAYVHLRVANLEEQLLFYQRWLGLQIHWREGDRVALGVGQADLLRLTRQPNARRYRGVTGLYHFALLYPNRGELARAIARLFALRYPNYPTDHILTKSTYLDDPEGNGIELYTESPEDGTWSMAGGDFSARRSDGSPSNGREPLDLEALFRHIAPGASLDAPAPPEMRLGHVHLHVRDVDEAVLFYHGVLGFDLMDQAEAMRAAFVSAGGYHHHIGLNTWQGRGAPAPPPDALGLLYFCMQLPAAQDLEDLAGRLRRAGVAYEEEGGLMLHDPSGNGILFTSSGGERASERVNQVQETKAH